jgi:hypothetical protein
MNQTEQIKETVAELIKTVSGLGYGMKKGERETSHATEIAKNLLEGKKTFSIEGISVFGKEWIEYKLNFGLSKKDSDPKIYYNTVSAELYKDIKIPSLTVEGVSLQALETKLQLPTGQLSAKDQQKHLKEISQEMKLVMDHKPEVFNALMVKFNPKLDFEIPAAMQAAQEKLYNENKRSHEFSNYYNLTPLEIYNVLNGRSVNKNLFRTHSAPAKVEGVQPKLSDLQFNTWVRIDFSKPPVDGERKVDLLQRKTYIIDKQLEHYNFLELKTPASRLAVEEALKKGSQVLVNNLNSTGEKKVLIEALPKYNSFLFHKLDGSQISRYTLNDYQKVQFNKEVSEFVEFSNANKNGEKKNEGITETGQVQRRNFPQNRVLGTDGQSTGLKK